MAEMILEVDESNNPLGGRPKKDFSKGARIHRSAHLLLLNKKGELLIQKRSSKKRTYPSLYDVSVSGSVREQETYKQTLCREVKEELGIAIPVRQLFEHKFFDEHDKAFKMVFLGRHEGPFTIQEEEVESVNWISLDAVEQEMAQRPELFCPTFIATFQLFLEKKDAYLAL